MKIMKSSLSKYFYDYLGIASSGLCLVHCLATPLMLFIQQYHFYQSPNISPDTQDSYWEYLFVFISFMAIYFTTQNIDSRKIQISFWAFFSLFAISILFEDDFENLQFVGYTSSIGLIITHIINIKYCNKCQIKNSPLPF
jgi:hypothetical protein